MTCKKEKKIYKEIWCGGMLVLINGGKVITGHSNNVYI
jgi:hypothetical protein